MTTFQIGRLEITRIEDFTDHGVPLKMLLPDVKDETIAENLHWLQPNFLDADGLAISVPIQSFLFRTRHHTILVDTCVGHQKSRHFPPFHLRNSAFLDNLTATGAAPEDVDYVFCTHMHSDHVGWNTRAQNGRWVPTFPNARYLFSKKDYETFDPRQANWPHYGGTDEETFLDSVLPVVEAGQAEFVEGEHRIGDALTILPAPGHSPGHSALLVEDSGDSGLFTGDSTHHPIQIADPELNSFTCWDVDLARSTRRKLLEDCCEHKRLLVPGHFAAPHCGRITPKGSGFHFNAGV